VVWPAGFADARERADALARRTSFRIGGVPEFLFEPEGEEEAGEVLAACHAQGIRLRILGGGCNLLVADGRLEGAVLATTRLRFERLGEDRLEIGAGASFPSLVARSAELGIPRLSGCPGIPGQVGGVVAMNAGGRFGCVADALLEVAGFDLEGRRFRRAVEPGDMGYRRTAFLDQALITSATFRRERALDREAARRQFQEASAWKRATQPLSAASAGCAFKNPGPGASAGALLDRLGLKGVRVGEAVVSAVHANFIVNEGGASFVDVEDLIGRVRERARAQAGVDLELELRVWR
jgi:UDP-N-acetylmuramate dehydrogenase